MKKLVLTVIFSSVLSAPVLAETMTVEFAPASGDKVTAVLDTTSHTININGTTSAFTWDEAANTLCAPGPDGEICVAFDGQVDEIGSTTTYTRNDGITGVATLLAKAE